MGTIRAIIKKAGSRTLYQQHRRCYIEKEKDKTCPRTRFRKDLMEQQAWREDGNEIIVCLDANQSIYTKVIGKELTAHDGLVMNEVVGTFTGKKVGATHCRGLQPIDGV